MGLDGINSKIIRMVPKVTALMMTQLINSIIKTSTYPEILKISRILPILKPDKCKSSPDSYRPICNLSVFNKIIQEWIKSSLLEYMTQNNILLPNHRSGLGLHSTMTAKSMIDYFIGKGTESNPITMMVNTDMSAAFDTVDHQVLLRKLKFYGVNEKGLSLMQSFLESRSSYIELESFQSEPVMNQPCSVIQGSRISGLLFLIYVNEVPVLHKLMKDESISRVMIGRISRSKGNISHDTSNFVDDSASIISFEDEEEAEDYMETFMEILEE